MRQPRGLIEYLNQEIYKKYKNGMSINEITTKYDLPYWRVVEAIKKVKLGDKKTMDKLIKAVEQWSIDKNLDQGNSFSQFAKSAEELGEVASALCRDDKDSLRDGIGDVVVTLIILAQQNGMDLHDCLNTAYDEIKGRTGVTTEDGRFIKESDL